MLSMTAACAHLGVVEDGTSVSWGRANGGGITNPVRLPDDGDGYRVPARWRDRGNQYGTDELVDFVVQVARRFETSWPGSRVTIADLSPMRGGPSQWHRSHQSGRDVDLVFFVTDEAGRPVDPEDMRHMGPDGASTDDKTAEWGKGMHLLFDVPRNWSLVRAILEHPGAQVQHIFLYEPLALMLLDHARAIGEPESIIERARALLKQPGDSAPHDDHMHVRIVCSSTDRAFGCQDYGVFQPLTKKLPAWPFAIRTLALAPVPAMLALVGLPILR
jgi:penicillin-insensitive murein endopeptidase